MKKRSVAAALVTLALAGCAAPNVDTPDHDPNLLRGVLEDIRVGWEEGNGDPFYTHFLEWDGARYFEGGEKTWVWWISSRTTSNPKRSWGYA